MEAFRHGMRLKLKYALPLAQTALAIGLLMWSYLWDRAQRGNDMPGPAPAFKLLVSINAPVGLLRAFLYRHLPDYWDDVTFILAIGLFWYWIALNILRFREGRSPVMFAWPPLRLFADLLMIASGAFLGWFSIVNGLGFLTWWWFVLCSAFYWVWCVVLIVFFGWDFLRCASQLSHRTSNAVQD
jgi:hypothetical protein